MTNQQFTPQQLYNWRVYEAIRQSGEYNMFDPRARDLAGLSRSEYSFVVKNYAALKWAIAEQDKVEREAK